MNLKIFKFANAAGLQTFFIKGLKQPELHPHRLHLAIPTMRRSRWRGCRIYPSLPTWRWWRFSPTMSSLVTTPPVPSRPQSSSHSPPSPPAVPPSTSSASLLPVTITLHTGVSSSRIANAVVDITPVVIYTCDDLLPPGLFVTTPSRAPAPSALIE